MSTRAAKKANKKKLSLRESLELSKETSRIVKEKKRATKADLLPYLICTI